MELLRKAKEAREQRASIVEQMKGLHEAANAAKRDLNKEENEQWDKMDKDVEALTSTITRLERQAEVEKLDTEKRFEKQEKEETRNSEEALKEKRSTAFKKFLRSGMSELNPEERQVMAEMRAQSVGTTTAGGYTVPEGFGTRLIEGLKDFGGIINAATIIRTASGNAMPFPTNDDTSNVGELLAENTQAATQDLVFGVRQLDAYKYSSKMLLISLELLQDSGIDIEGLIARKLTERIGRIFATHCATGTGTAQPNGLMTAASASGITALVSSITRANLVDVVHSIDPAYRNSAACRWVFNDSTLKAIKKLSIGSGDDRPLWQPSMQVGAPDTIEGYPYIIDQGVASIGASAKSIAFGDISEYYIRQVMDVMLVRFGEKYMDYAQVGFVAFARMDAELMNTAAVKTLVHAAS
jgi:HK97 family phage major capsid protein